MKMIDKFVEREVEKRKTRTYCKHRLNHLFIIQDRINNIPVPENLFNESYLWFLENIPECEPKQEVLREIEGAANERA